MDGTSSGNDGYTTFRLEGRGPIFRYDKGHVADRLDLALHDISDLLGVREMPTYVCSARAGALDDAQKAAIAQICYIGERKAPLVVSPYDSSVATVWYSAFFAQKIRNLTGRRFLYLIQDYETAFYPGGSLGALAESTYQFDYAALFSTKPLQDFFLTRRIGNFNRAVPDYIYFNNACSTHLPEKSDFISKKENKTFKCVLYSRPVVDRNMFDLAALALCRAFKEGVFDNERWEFYGIGLGETTILLGGSTSLKQMPRMTLKEYEETIHTYDIGVCLMASPHPSLLPFDLAGAGALVVTNTFATKSPSYFAEISENIIACDPSLHELVDGIRSAVERVGSLEKRYSAASNMSYPCRWDDTFLEEHSRFISKIFGKYDDAVRGTR